MIPGIIPFSDTLYPNSNLIEILRTLTLDTNLRICLDAGDSRSYDGSSQLWKDRSGGGYDFNRGTTTSSETSDPTFNGIVGRQSVGEYFSVDGGDWFTLGQANPSWVDSFHKAGAKLTIVEWFYANNVTATTQFNGRIGDPNNAGLTSFGGFSFGTSESTLRAIGFGVYQTSGSLAYSKKSTTLITNNSWNFAAVSVDITAGNVIMHVNGTNETSTGQSYSSPITTAAVGSLQIGALGGGQEPENSGNRFSGVAIWDRALSGTELSTVFSATRIKYGV